MTGKKLILASLAAALLIAAPAESQTSIPAQPTYADLADLALAAPVAAHVRVKRAVRLKGADAAGVAAGKTRFYVEADMLSLIQGAGGLPPQVSYVVDLPNLPSGKPPKLAKNSEFLLLADKVAGRPGELRLIAPDAQIAWAPQHGDSVRRILGEASRSDAPPKISGIGRAFHVPGAVAGESETQIFLQTADGQPISLNVLRRPGEQPQWAVALSEVVDEAARPPLPNSLLWYRLACTLPKTLPRHSFAEAEAEHGRAIEADYRLILAQLGPCSRSRSRT